MSFREIFRRILKKRRYRCFEMLHFLKNLLQLTINPARGWEDVSHDGELPSMLCRDGFYPLLGFTALTCAANFLKVDMTPTLISVIQDAIITFSVYFATLFFAEFVFGVTMSKISDKEPSPRKNSTVIIYALSMMAVINIIINLVPIDLAVLKFLPVYVGFVLYKSMRYLSVPQERTGHFMFMSLFSIIAVPYALIMLFHLLMQ